MQRLQLSQHNYPQRPPPPSTITLASIFQHMNFGVWDTNIQSITPSLKHPSTESSNALCRASWLSSFHQILFSCLWCLQVYFPDDILPPDYVHSSLPKHPILVFHAHIGSPVLTFSEIIVEVIVFPTEGLIFILPGEPATGQYLPSQSHSSI